MIDWFSRIIWLVLLLAFVVTGCEQGSKREVLPTIVLLDPNFVAPGYVSSAIEATGGQQVWAKTEELDRGCVVTLYKPDGSFYLTEQHHKICPWDNSIQISAVEPKCKFVWQVSKGQFEALKGGDCDDILPVGVDRLGFAEAILAVATAPVRLLDESVESVRASSAVKMEGLWYYPIEQTPIYNYNLPYWKKVIFYQNRDTALVDMLWFVGIDGRILVIRGYDYRELEKGAVYLPCRIEIFSADSRGILQSWLVKIDY